MSRCILVVAGTHRGKSTYIKKRIRSYPNLIYDVKGEYKRGFKVWRDIGNREGFLDYIINNEIENTCIVLEEATFYLSNRHYSSKCEQLIINKWKSKNTFFLVYHSLKKIPLGLYDLCDYMVLFKTNDQIYHIDKKHPEEVIEGWREVQEKSKNNKHFHKFIKLDDID